MSTRNKDESKKKFVSKESSSIKKSSSKKDSHKSEKKESDKIRLKSTSTTIIDENSDVKKSSILSKASHKLQNEKLLEVATKSSKKEEKVPPSSRVTSKKEKKVTKQSSEKGGQETSLLKKELSKPEKVIQSKSSSKMKTDASKSKKDATDHEIPSAPSSSRVKKTQYFPSKNLYSNALKSTELQKKLAELSARQNIQDKSTPRKPLMANKNITPSPHQKINKTDSSKIKNSIDVVKKASQKIFSPNSVRIHHTKPKIKEKIKRDSSPDTSSMSERPRTATLRKGSIVNTNIVGPEVSEKNKQPSNTEKEAEISESPPKVPSRSNSEDYEDDFESYESDFESYSSSDDISKLAKISGEETSSVSTSSENIFVKRDPSPTVLQTQVKKVSSAHTEDERAHDSGTFELPEFKHKQILENIKEIVDKKNDLKDKITTTSLSDEGFEELRSLQFIDFLEAQKRYEKRMYLETMKKRGEEILNMITLNVVTYTLFDLPAVPYDEFIMKYGQTDTIQMSVQTGEDNPTIGTQTNTIESVTKWTQNPIKFSSFDQNQENFWTTYKKELLGVGFDADDTTTENFNKIEFKDEKRLKLFLNQSVELVLDILAEANIKNIDKLEKNERDVPFSDGYIELNTSSDIFENTRIQTMSVFPKNSNHILTVHVRNDEPDDSVKSILCLWNLSDFTTPKKTMISYGEITCTAFSDDYFDFIFAGQKDGMVLMWNVKDKRSMYDIENKTPTSTSDMSSGHFAKIVGIQPIINNKENKGYFDENENIEVCSLDEEGYLIIWSVYTDPDLDKSINDTILMNTTTVNLQDRYSQYPSLHCSDFILRERHIYVSTNYGFIAHFIIFGSRRDIKKFEPASTIDATCIVACPFSPAYFLAGYVDGSIQMYSTSSSKSLTTFRNNEEIISSSVEIIQWSYTRPFVFYVKDSKSVIHIWELNKNDFGPTHSISIKENISCIKLSPVIDPELEETAYMLIGTNNGKVYLHKLNREHGQESYKDFKDEVSTFHDYVKRL